MSMDEQRKQQIKAHLDEANARLDADPALEQQLNQARRRALAPPQRSWIVQHAPALGMATAAVLTVSLLAPRMLSPDKRFPAFSGEVGVSEFELISQLEDFEQDVEFYYWLEQVDGGTG